MNMDTKYIFIDDEDNKTVQGIAGFFQSKGDHILVARVRPLEKWADQVESLKVLFNFNPENRRELSEEVKEQINHIKKALKLNINEAPNGIILDLRLDVKVDTNYKGSSFAQELRNLSTDDKKIDFPLVLCSGGNNLNELYKPDTTSHDLFDLKVEKESLDRNSSKIIRKKLKALSSGYQKIADQKKVDFIFACGLEEEIDYRIVDYIETLTNKNAPVHEFARFILRYMIRVPGVLIDERLLAARFGVDFEKSSMNSWNLFLDSIDKTKYKGVFSGGWERWWMHRLLSWWRDNIDEQVSLQNLRAEERVEKINLHLGTSLVPQKKTKFDSNDYFWHVCKSSKRPLALEDGVLAIMEYQRVPWQEDEYYSPKAAIRGKANSIHPMHRNKLNQLKDQHVKKRKNG
jgi:hypothetical protein